MRDSNPRLPACKAGTLAAEFDPKSVVASMKARILSPIESVVCGTITDKGLPAISADIRFITRNASDLTSHTVFKIGSSSDASTGAPPKIDGVGDRLGIAVADAVGSVFPYCDTRIPKSTESTSPE